MKSSYKGCEQCLRQQKSGFTLIELLVVIAIIAILAAILFPVFTSAKESAKKSQCLNNLKQLSQGLQMYVSDNNDYAPRILQNQYNMFYTDFTRKKLGFFGAIYTKTTKNKNVMFCPSDTLAIQGHWAEKLGTTSDYNLTSYWANG
ncbi:MAG TPA: prepilin-type N-terminal cleavage/methylation domain-containing protein, partial [Armatimonadota bacterium]|nr:prepilin-type N-terminal cleavage/methylation domain-containing protein [Armatimonadota bacterium]